MPTSSRLRPGLLQLLISGVWILRRVDGAHLWPLHFTLINSAVILNIALFLTLAEWLISPSCLKITGTKLSASTQGLAMPYLTTGHNNISVSLSTNMVLMRIVSKQLLSPGWQNAAWTELPPASHRSPGQHHHKSWARFTVPVNKFQVSAGYVSLQNEILRCYSDLTTESYWRTDTASAVLQVTCNNCRSSH